MRIVSRFLFALLVVFAAISAATSQTPLATQVPSPAPATAQPARLDIEQMRQQLSLIEPHIQRETLNDADLDRLRLRLFPIFDGVQAIIDRESPRLDEINARLEKIGPAPKNNETPESAEVTRNRAEQEARKKEIDETIRVARLVQVRAEQAQAAIADYRRKLFAREILERSESIASPWLWADVARAIPAAAADFVALVQFRVRQAVNILDATSIAIFVALILLLLFAHRPAHTLLARTLDRWVSEDSVLPKRGQRALGALRGALLRTLLPLAVALVLTVALRMLGLGSDRVGEFLQVLMFLMPVLAFMYGLLVGILQPDRPHWRVAQIEQRTAELLFPAFWAMILVVFTGKVAEAACQSISAALPIIVAAKGLTALIVAAILARALHQVDASLSKSDQSLDEFGPAIAGGAGNTLAIILKVVGWIAIVGIFAAALMGYVALAAFISDQLIWLLALGTLLSLLMIIIDEFLVKGTIDGSEISRRIRASTGISPGSIRQIGVLTAGFMQLMICTAGMIIALSSFGVNSGDLVGSLRSVLFGFQIGGVTISISNIMTSITVFVVIFMIFRAIHRWIENTWLPTTGLDSGLQNSIATIFSYVGFIVAAGLSMSYLGFSLDKMAIVAGALSVGIGFGLQSIVNNFVSGLILLWERPIKVGDLIAVGGETGRVKRINVRSTEVETADRYSLIVPNSEFISGRVKNMMHANRLARIVIPMSVAPTADPHLIRKELLDSANNNQEVLTTPPAEVVFLDVTSTSLNFELRCFVDIDAQVSVRSDLMFDIFRRLKLLDVIVPPPKVAAGVSDIRDMVEAISDVVQHPNPKKSKVRET